MPSKPAIISQKDVTRIVKGYAAAGIAAGIVVKDGEVRILPLDRINGTEAPSESAEEAYLNWKANRAG